MPDDTTMEFPFNPHNNLPMMLVDDIGPAMAGLTRQDSDLLTNPRAMQSYLSVLDQVNQNITSSQKELLLWHQRLGHAGFQWNQALMMGQGGEPPILAT